MVVAVAVIAVDTHTHTHNQQQPGSVHQGFHSVQINGSSSADEWLEKKLESRKVNSKGEILLSFDYRLRLPMELWLKSIFHSTAEAGHASCQLGSILLYLFTLAGRSFPNAILMQLLSPLCCGSAHTHTELERVK